MPYRALMSTKGTEHLRARAAHYRHEAARTQERHRLILYRALAAHLEQEVAELERALKSNQPAPPGIANHTHTSDRPDND
jgi:hypothetical protein